MVIGNWTLSIWVYETMQWFTWVTTEKLLPSPQFPIPNAHKQPLLNQLCKQWLFNYDITYQSYIFTMLNFLCNAS